ncbi:MAG: adenylyltransferase/cytidyltransferase family protein [Nocardioidaceae bacterium]|nr:adenylyltransferase/cytidyltransferase family protein [Nocardioidaceae bacterium]NUS49593.1 adenylyltransferase/cytidyltransferase family protein [Nocardioidaceae bacterium]
MAAHPARASIVSGYFGPLHQGHLDLFEAARELTGYLVVIVNNDAQQVLKKGRVIQGDTARARIVAALRCVDDVVVAEDEGPGIDRTFDVVRARYPDTELVFCNGGDRSDVNTLPEAERASAERNRITLRYGIGGDDKADSSSRILAAMEDD